MYYKFQNVQENAMWEKDIIYIINYNDNFNF